MRNLESRLERLERHVYGQGPQPERLPPRLTIPGDRPKIGAWLKRPGVPHLLIPDRDDRREPSEPIA